LEGGRTVGHSEEHHKRLEEATVSVEGHFLFIFGLDMYVIETPSDIKFCEVPGSTELGDKFRDKREGVSGTCGAGAELLRSGRELTTKVKEQPWPQLVCCASIDCHACGCVFQED